jgi:hypothetical protein
MKKKLFNILPTFIKKQKHADKIAHAFFGTLFYLVLNFFFSSELSLFLTFVLAVGVEIYDKYKGGKSDIIDIFATILIPIILFLIILLKNILILTLYYKYN